MHNISNHSDDSLTFYRNIESGRAVLALVRSAAVASAPAEKTIIKDGENKLWVTSDMALLVADGVSADIFLTIEKSKTHRLISLDVGQGAVANIFLAFDDKAKDEPMVVTMDSSVAKDGRLCYGAFLDLAQTGRLLNRVFLNDQGAMAQLLLVGNHQGEESGFMDTTTNIFHEKGDTLSQIVVRAVVDEQQAMIAQVDTEIAPLATSADTAQDIKAMVLSEQAVFCGKPELNIKHDQVKAKHGLSVGALDDEQVFYLMARGIDRGTAEKLLRSSFFINGLAMFEPRDKNKFIDWLTPLVADKEFHHE